jgi:hypothetical protein
MPELAAFGVSVGTVYADPPYGVGCVQVRSAESLKMRRSPGPKDGKARGTLGSGSAGSASLLRAKGRFVPARAYMPVIGDESTETAVKAYAAAVSAWPEAIQIWWGANHYSAALPSSPCWIVWDKQNSGVYADGEMAWCSHRSPVRIFTHRWNGMLRASERDEDRIHPNQKPIALASWCLAKYHPGGVVLDPFSGSGSALIAARRLGLTAIGIEMSEDYCEAIVRRLSQHCLDLGPADFAPQAAGAEEAEVLSMDTLWEGRYA